MIARRYQQRSVFEAVIGPMEKMVEGPVEPELERLDEINAELCLTTGAPNFAPESS